MATKSIAQTYNYFISNQVMSVMAPFSTNLLTTINTLRAYGTTETNLNSIVSTSITYSFFYQINTTVDYTLLNKYLIDTGYVNIIKDPVNTNSYILQFHLYTQFVGGAVSGALDSYVYNIDNNKTYVAWNIYLALYPNYIYLFTISNNINGNFIFGPADNGSSEKINVTTSQATVDYTNLYAELNRLNTLLATFQR